MEQCLENGIVCLDMPLKVPDLINTVGMMVENIERRKRKRKNKPKERSGEERNCIDEAKKLLMFRNNMTEDEAHRYLQKCSMDSGCGLTEMAAMVLTLMKE